MDFGLCLVGLKERDKKVLMKDTVVNGVEDWEKGGKSIGKVINDGDLISQWRFSKVFRVRVARVFEGKGWLHIA